MSVFLMQDQPFPITFREVVNAPGDMIVTDQVFERRYEDKSVVAKLQLILQDEALATTGKRGVLTGNTFPWKVLLSAATSMVPESIGYNLDLNFILSPKDGDGRHTLMKIKMSGDVCSILNHIVGDTKTHFNSSEVNLQVAFDFTHGSVTDNANQPNFHVLAAMPIHPMRIYKQNYSKEVHLTEDFAHKLVSSLRGNVSARLTIAFSKRLAPTTVIQDDSRTRNLNKKILQEKILCDFTLVAAKGFEIQCHQMILQATSPFFEKMFHTDCQEMRDKKCKLDLSEDGLTALLEFLYTSDITKPNESPSVALELLEISHELAISDLESKMKTLIIQNHENEEWLDFEKALRLFIRCTKLDLDGYDEIKEKAAKVIRMKKTELKHSAAFAELLESNRKFAKEFLSHFI